MRALRVIVNDIARAMRRNGKRFAHGGCTPGHCNATAMLFQYADQLRRATERQKTKTKIKGRHGRSALAKSLDKSPIEITK
jgi:hypothetical protein